MNLDFIAWNGMEQIQVGIEFPVVRIFFVLTLTGKNQFTSVLLRNKLLVIYYFVGVIACTTGFSLCGHAQTFSGKSNSLKVEITDPELAKESKKPVVVRWIYPSESLQIVNKEVMNLKLGISSKSPVVKVTLIVNNQVVEVFENFSNKDSGYQFDAWLEKAVHLQTGSNDLQLIVQNEQGALKHQRKIEVQMSASLRKDHAILFGTEEYDTWDNLDGPVRDAERMGRVLEESGFNIEIVRNTTTFSLLSKLEEYVSKQFQPNDQLFIYFAGHGYFNPSSGEGYLVCKNSVNLPDANTTYISYSAIKSIINNIPAQHILLLMDAVKGRGKELTTEVIELEDQAENSESSVKPEQKTRLGILSGSLDYEQKLNHSAGSPLSRAFVTYLKKSERSEQPSWGELLKEYKDIDPTPIYVEFGDHNSGKRGFTFRKPRSGN